MGREKILWLRIRRGFKFRFMNEFLVRCMYRFRKFMKWNLDIFIVRGFEVFF